MVFFTVKSGARLGALLGIVCLGLAAVGCGSSSSSTPTASHSSAKPSGTANVAYAASLLYLNEKIVAPAFQSATGLKYSGRAGPSDGLQAEISSGEISPNVFEAVGGDNIEPLFPKFTKWYIQYASTSIVVAYNPKSKYASDFKAIASGAKPIQDLFPLMEKSGFKLGRTDPNTDPQGRAFIYMLELAQAQYHLPKDTVSKILGTSNFADPNSPQIYDEAALPASAGRPARRLQRLPVAGDPAAPELHQAAGHDQPRLVRPGRPLPHRVDYHHGQRDQTRFAARRRHHHDRATEFGRHRLRQVRAVARRTGLVQEGGLHSAQADRVRHDQRSPLIDQ